MKIVFVGTPEFGAIILAELCQTNLKPILVVTAPDKLVDRKQILTPPAVKVTAEKFKILVLQPEKIKDVISNLQNTNPDLIVVAAYGQILPKEILAIPKYGCWNIHPSLLPKYRGSSPIQTAILNGDKTTGVTIILMDEKMDHGPILTQKSLVIEKDESSATLQDKLANLGARLLMETIQKWTKAMIKPIPQDETKVTQTKILTKENGRINWQKTAQNLEREIKAYSPWPGSYTTWQKKGKSVQIKILQARVLKTKGGLTYPIGKTLVAPQNAICVQCGKGFLAGGGDFLVIERLQMEGKKEMGAEEFLRGQSGFIGTIFK